jgi:hypothetical protein
MTTTRSSRGIEEFKQYCGCNVCFLRMERGEQVDELHIGENSKKCANINCDRYFNSTCYQSNTCVCKARIHCKKCSKLYIQNGYDECLECVGLEPAIRNHGNRTSGPGAGADDVFDNDNEQVSDDHRLDSEKSHAQESKIEEGNNQKESEVTNLSSVEESSSTEVKTDFPHSGMDDAALADKVEKVGKLGKFLCQRMH